MNVNLLNKMKTFRSSYDVWCFMLVYIKKQHIIQSGTCNFSLSKGPTNTGSRIVRCMHNVYLYLIYYTWYIYILHIWWKSIAFYPLFRRAGNISDFAHIKQTSLASFYVEPDIFDAKSNVGISMFWMLGYWPIWTWNEQCKGKVIEVRKFNQPVLIPFNVQCWTVDFYTSMEHTL